MAEARQRDRGTYNDHHGNGDDDVGQSSGPKPDDRIDEVGVKPGDVGDNGSLCEGRISYTKKGYRGTISLRRAY